MTLLRNKYTRTAVAAVLIILCLFLLAGCGSDKKGKIEIHSSSSDTAVTVSRKGI
jgi:predicted small lipoprotein YifL